MMPARELSRSLSPGDQTGTTNLPGMIRDSSPPGRGRRIGHHGRTPGDPRCQFKQPTLTRRFTPPSPAGRGGLGVGHLVAPVRSPALPRFALKLQCAVSRRQIASLAKSTPCRLLDTGTTPREPRLVPEEAKPVRLLDRVREAIRVRHYSIRTEEAYV